MSNTTPNRGRWQKGQSGNPSGLAKFERTLADLLREKGDKPGYGDIPFKKLMVGYIWEAVAFGEVELIGGKRIDLNTRDWLDLVKWLNVHIDGLLHVQKLLGDDLPAHPLDTEPVQADSSIALDQPQLQSTVPTHVENPDIS